MSKAGDEDEQDRKRTRHIDEHLGARVRFIRENHGLTQADMARKLDISTNQWGRHESGANRLPAARLWQFCEALKIDITSVFRGQPFSGAVPTATFERLPEPQSLFGAHDAGGQAEAPPEHGGLVQRIGAAARDLPEARQRTALAVIRALKDEGDR
ncbi:MULTISPECIES: helix-turn-helix domain-containing protein [unclassified Brevundimonas]|uniref:helix-turn-helix domain-containing protein n=1 Tax=unclassified Brevundimonas TaxID=2622653 RepID=UPI0025C432CA|nr:MULTISPECIES: helix-turn-helix transcriptional regulator [unclassified Brevundimonas]